MTEPATIIDAPLAAAPRGKMLGLRVALIVAAAYEAIEAAWRIVFGGTHAQGLGELISKVRLASHPLLALLALALAATGRVRHAIVALGAIVMVSWLNYLPSLGLLDLHNGWDIQWATKQIVVFPLAAAFGVTLAARDRRLALATALVCIGTLSHALDILAFAIGVIIRGP